MGIAMAVHGWCCSIGEPAVFEGHQGWGKRGKMD